MMPGGFAMLVVMPIAGLVTGHFQPKYLMVLGLTGIALSMWYSTSLTPDASFDYFAWVRVYQTVGLPFLFIPINTVAYDGLPANKTNQASALMNVARNLGGSIGISLANVVLTQRTQFHQSRLAENTMPSSPVISVHAATGDKLFHASRRPGGRSPQPGDGVFRPADSNPGDNLSLYRRVPCLRHCRGADDSACPGSWSGGCRYQAQAAVGH